MHSGPRAVEGLILLLLQQMNNQKSSEVIYTVAEFKAKPFQQIALKHRPYYPPSFSKSSSCTPVLLGLITPQRLISTFNMEVVFLAAFSTSPKSQET